MTLGTKQNSLDCHHLIPCLLWIPRNVCCSLCQRFCCWTSSETLTETDFDAHLGESMLAQKRFLSCCNHPPEKTCYDTVTYTVIKWLQHRCKPSPKPTTSTWCCQASFLIQKAFLSSQTSKFFTFNRFPDWTTNAWNCIHIFLVLLVVLVILNMSGFLLGCWNLSVRKPI